MEIDIGGIKACIDHYKGINNTPAIMIARQAERDLHDQGFLDPHTAWLNWSDEALVLSIDGDLIGIILFNVTDGDHSAFVKLSWVVPSHRCNGHFSRMWVILKEHLLDRQIVRIDSGVAFNNQDMHAICRKQGRKAVSISYTYRLV